MFWFWTFIKLEGIVRLYAYAYNLKNLSKISKMGKDRDSWNIVLCRNSRISVQVSWPVISPVFYYIIDFSYISSKIWKISATRENSNVRCSKNLLNQFKSKRRLGKWHFRKTRLACERINYVFSKGEEDLTERPLYIKLMNKPRKYHLSEIFYQRNLTNYSISLPLNQT